MAFGGEGGRGVKKVKKVEGEKLSSKEVAGIFWNNERKVIRTLQKGTFIIASCRQSASHLLDFQLPPSQDL